MENEELLNKYKYVSANITARTAGAFIDSIILAVLSVLFLFLSANVILPNIKYYSDNRSIIDNEQMNSGLYYINNTEKTLIDTSYYYKEDPNAALKGKYADYLILNRLEYTYLSYLTGNNIASGYSANVDYNVAWLNNKKPSEVINIKVINMDVFGIKEGELSSTYFITTDLDNVLATIKPEFITVKEGVTTVDSNVTKYITSACKNATTIISNCPTCIEATNKVNIASNLTIFFTLLISGILTYLILPLCTKYGRTVGKLITKVGLCDKNGKRVRIYQLFLRIVPYIVGIAILSFLPIANSALYALSFILPIILLLVSVGMLSLKHDHRTIHDYIANTVVIDTRYTEEIDK